MSAIAQTCEVASVLDLGALRRMSYAELDELYRNARRPNVISDLDGHARGAMLATSAHWTSGVVAAHIWSLGGSILLF